MFPSLFTPSIFISRRGLIEKGTVGLPSPGLDIRTNGAVRFSVTVAPNASVRSPRVAAHLLFSDGAGMMARKELKEIIGSGDTFRYEFQAPPSLLANSRFVLQELFRCEVFEDPWVGSYGPIPNERPWGAWPHLCEVETRECLSQRPILVPCGLF